MNYADIIGRDKIYTLETDSISCNVEDLKPLLLSKDINYMVGKELGQMDIENETITDLIVCGKKCYSAKYEKYNKTNTEYTLSYKHRFKGVPSYKLNFEVFIELIEKKTITFKDITLFIRELYSSKKTRIIIGKMNKTINI